MLLLMITGSLGIRILLVYSRIVQSIKYSINYWFMQTKQSTRDDNITKLFLSRNHLPVSPRYSQIPKTKTAIQPLIGNFLQNTLATFNEPKFSETEENKSIQKYSPPYQSLRKQYQHLSNNVNLCDPQKQATGLKIKASRSPEPIRQMIKRARQQSLDSVLKPTQESFYGEEGDNPCQFTFGN